MMESVEFAVRTPKNKPNVVEARYGCVCGCKPRARYERGTNEAEHEHCCCGRVHFIGDEATQAKSPENPGRSSSQAWRSCFGRPSLL